MKMHLLIYIKFQTYILIIYIIINFLLEILVEILNLIFKSYNY